MGKKQQRYAVVKEFCGCLIIMYEGTFRQVVGATERIEKTSRYNNISRIILPKPDKVVDV